MLFCHYSRKFAQRGPILVLYDCIFIYNSMIHIRWDQHWLHDDVIEWEHFPRYWPFVRGIHQSVVNSPHKGQWCGASMFSLICAWINGWVNNHEAGDLRRHRAHYDVTVMLIKHYNWACDEVFIIHTSPIIYRINTRDDLLLTRVNISFNSHVIYYVTNYMFVSYWDSNLPDGLSFLHRNKNRCTHFILWFDSMRYIYIFSLQSFGSSVHTAVNT